MRRDVVVKTIVVTAALLAALMALSFGRPMSPSSNFNDTVSTSGWDVHRSDEYGFWFYYPPTHAVINEIEGLHPNPVHKKRGKFWIFGIQIPVVNELRRGQGSIFDSGQAQSDGSGCAIKIKYVFECACIGTKRVQARLSLFRRARLFWRGNIGCFQPKQNSAGALGAFWWLKMCVKDVHGRHYDTLFAA